MIKKSLACGLLFLGSVLMANLASALSLGEMTLHSALNEPLRASIPFKDAADLSESQIIARLASVDDFEKAGVDYAYFLGDLKFAVVIDGQGGGVIKVSSQDPIVEPYLDFLMEARWPSGRMLREYTVLLDLPVLTEGATQSVETAKGGAASQAAQASQPAEIVQESLIVEEAAPASEGIQPRIGLQRRALPASEKETEYRVQHDDTLWEISVRFRPSGDVSVQQTMLALLRNNPEAFINGNVNRLKSGYVLRLPSAAEAAETSFKAAVAEVKRQNDIWMGKSSAESAAAPQVMASDAVDASEPEAAAAPEARLSIATPGQDEISEGSDEAGAQSAALRDALAASEESLEKSRRDNEELSSRLEDLEDQLSTLQRLLQLKDDQLAALQAQQVKADEAPEEATPVAPATPPEVAAVTPDKPESAPDAAAVSEPAAEPAPQPQPEPESTSMADMLGADRQLLTNIALAAAILLALVLLMRFLKQRREAREEEERIVASHLEEIQSESEGAFEGAEEAYEQEDLGAAETPETEEARNELEQILGEGDEEPALSTEELLGDEPLEAETESFEAETGDAAAEADIYVAYGRYDQAAELLKNAIAKEPQRPDLRVKLLGVYLETREKEPFLAEYEALEKLEDQAALSQVRDSMSAMEGVSDWLRDNESPGLADTAPVLEEPGTGEESAVEALSDLDLGDTEEQDQELEFDLNLEDEDLELGGDIDFELDTATESESESETAEADADEGSADLEFDLDLDEDLGAGLVTEEAEVEPETEPLTTDDSLETSDEELSLDVDLDSLDKELDSLGSDLNLEEELGGDLDLGADFGEDLELGDELEPEEGAPVEEAPVAEEPVAESEPEPTPDTIDTLEPELAQLSSAEEGEEMDDFGLLGDSDEVSTKLDLARAYIDMGDNEGAKEMLQEVMQEGNDTQKEEASSLLERL